MAATSSSPLLAGASAWQSFPQKNSSSSSNNGNGGSGSPQPTASSPPPLSSQSARTWGSQLLGGEQVANKRSSQISNHNDPIGSRPGSSTGSALANRQTSQDNGVRPIGSQRPSASAAAGVFAAANSAVARSRATSPASQLGNGMTFDNGSSSYGLMGMGTSYSTHHPFRLENSSSPSFVSAQSYQPNDFMSSPSSSLSHQRAAAGTPKLVVDGFRSHEVAGGTDEAGQNASMQTRSMLSAQNFKYGDMQGPLSPTGSATSALNSITAKTGEANGPTTAYPFPAPAVNESNARPRFSQSMISASRSETTGSVQSVGSGHPPLSSPTPFLAIPQALSSSVSLLSPTAATHGSAAAAPSSRAFSPFESPPRGSHGNALIETPARKGDGLPNELDSQLQSSTLMLDVLDRLLQVETSMKTIQRDVSALNRNVGQLLERAREHTLGTPSQQSASTFGPGKHPHHQNQSHGALAGTNNVNGELRSMSTQIAQLTANVSQLMMLGNVSASSIAASQSTYGQSTPLAGLGLGAGTPQISGSSYMSTPQMGTLPGTPHGHASTHSRMVMPGGMSDSPRGPGSSFGASHPTVDRNSRLSPRPGASPGPTSNRRWSSMAPATPDVSMPMGAMNPPDANVIVTKWEHLNLHQDLLHCILKYGLGPPNKIQQRALPFLLRGSDIIAQAPPTQERIASYVIPTLQLVLNVIRGQSMPAHLGVRGPIALMISTTVDQATQAQRMALGLGSALGIRVHIAAASSLDVSQEAAGLIQMQPQIVVGTPQKMMDLFNYLANKTKGAISLDDIRLVVLDEVDQLIARNLADHVSTLLRILPMPRVVTTKPGHSNDGARSPSLSPGLPAMSGNVFNPFESAGQATPPAAVTTTDRQTAIFSNTVPQDVLNFAQSIHLRESVRVLVRRDGNQAGQLTTSVGTSAAPTMSSSYSNLSSSNLSMGASAGQMQPGPGHALGATAANNHLNPASDPLLASLRGLRQYYLYVAVSTGGNNIGGLQSNQPNASQISHAIEMKLDVITDLLEDIDFGQAVIYTASSATHEAVTYKLASKGIEALALHRDMAHTTRQQVLAKYRSSATSASGLQYHQAGNQVVGSQLSAGTSNSNGQAKSKKALVVFDVVVHPKDVHQVPFIVFYDLPRSVEEYKEKISCAASSHAGGRPGVCVNVVTGSGGPRGDIEMLKTLECHLGCKMAELPMNPSQILQF